jgi:beta-lactamase regulating signal transducer with metallopeptidase domain
MPATTTTQQPLPRTTLQTETPASAQSTDLTAASTTLLSINTTTATPVSTTVFAMSTTQASNNDNTALIGGIVGGVVALILFIGLVAFIVARKRRSKNKSVENTVHQKDVPMTSASNYGKVAAILPEYESFNRDSAGYEVGNINIANIDANYDKSNIVL